MLSRRWRAGYDYRAFADSIGAARFYIEPELYRSLPTGKGWEANLAALDQFVAEGRTILVSTPASMMKLVNETGGPTGLAKELEYLFRKYGLVLSSDGTRLVPSGVTH